MSTANETAAQFVGRARLTFRDHAGYMYDRWDKLKADIEQLPPEAKKIAFLTLLPEADEVPVATDLMIAALNHAEWTEKELLDLMEQCYESGYWPWQYGSWWMPTAPARGQGALWHAVHRHEAGQAYPELLVRFLACPLLRMMQPDVKSLSKALEAAVRRPQVIEVLLTSLAAACDQTDLRDAGYTTAALPHLLLQVHQACGEDPAATGRMLVTLLGAAESKPPARWWAAWSAATSHWRSETCRHFCETLWQLPTDRGLTVDPLSHTLIRAVIWGVAPHGTPETCERLGALASHWMTASGGQSWDHGISFATAAIHVLGRIGEPALPHLQTLARKIKHKNVRKAIDEAVAAVAGSQQIDNETLLDLNVETAGLDAAGRRTWLLGDCLALLELNERGRPEVQYQVKGRSSATPPKAVKEAYAAELAEIKRTSKRLTESCATQRFRLEQALMNERTWLLLHWQRSFGANPVLANLARRMVWRAETPAGARLLLRPDGAGAWLAADDMPVRLADESRLSLAHPVALSREEQTAWQGHIVRHRLVQPTKQMFRETYLITPAEEQTVTYSNRFATHVIPHGRLYALIRERGWSGLGYTGAEEPARKDWPGHRVRAQLSHAYSDVNELSATMTLDRVSFVRLEPVRGRLAPAGEIALGDVPPVIFSETMRDVDLVVGVGSIGTDAFWEDWEARRQANAALWGVQRAAYESQLAATADRRADLFREVWPALGLGDRVWTEGRFVLVQGRLRLYRIHLGSGNIHMEPEGRYLCIVPAGRRVQEVYVPFEEGDSKTAEILSKVLLLAEDDQITDQTIMRQIR